MCAHQYNECYEWSSCFDHLIEINWAADISSNKASSFLAVSLIHNLYTIYCKTYQVDIKFAIQYLQ